MDDLKFGDEIELTSQYADDIKRRFIFMSWMGNEMKGYARIAVLQDNGSGFDSQGRWIEGMGLVLQGDSFVHVDKIVKKK